MNKNHNIHVLHIASGDLWAGAEVQLFTLAQALQKNTNTVVEVILLNYGKLEQELKSIGIKVTVLDETQHNSFIIMCKLVAIIRKYPPDIIHTHRLKENIIGAIAAKLGSNIASLRTVHGAAEHSLPWYKLPKRLILLIDWLCAQHLQQCTISVSDELSTILKKRYPKINIQTICNGIDISMLTNKIDTNKNPPQEKTNTFKIGIAGRLVPIKRIDLFIQIAQQMLTSESPHKLSFHVYGDGPLRSKLEELSKQLKIDTQITFEGHCENIHQKIQELDLLLLTSDHEGLPMVLLEAMALKTPIISHSVGGITHLLKSNTCDQNTCGLLVDRQETEGYIKLIQRMLNDTELYTNISNCAYSRVKNFYSAETNAKNYYNTYLKYIDTAKR